MAIKRPPPGLLEPRCPTCPICLDEVACDGDSFWCEACGATWPCEGGWQNDPGAWSDDQAAQCGGIKQPFLKSKYDNIRYDEIRCLLDHGHKPDHRGEGGISWPRQDSLGKPIREQDRWAG